MSRERPISVLVIDDSAANRRAISRILEASPGIRVVDRAADGEEGLRKAIELKPDLITLDLEMPRLDGFSFLRLLMVKCPTPVIVLSSYGHPSDVFKALQLGAFDFVAKPQTTSSLETVRAELVEKVRAVRFVRREEAPAPIAPSSRPAKAAVLEAAKPVQVVLVGASTGGPPAVQRLLEALAGLPVCVLIAQHMPARFTQAFAERLDQTLAFQVTEAKTGDRLEAGKVYVAPGGEQLEVLERDGVLTVIVTASEPEDMYAPSIDRLFRSLAHTPLVESVHAVVLTGMGHDGAQGVKALARKGATVWAEAEGSAIVFGMPEAAIATGAVAHVYELPKLGTELVRALKRANRW